MMAKVSEWGWGRRESGSLSPGLFSQSDRLPCAPWSLPPPGCVAGDLFLSFSFVICKMGW